MVSRLNPYLSFHKNAREAMEFYNEVLGGTLVVNTFGEFGQAESDEADLVMHAMLETDDGIALMGADTPSHMEYQPQNGATTISLSGDDSDRLHGYWDKLCDGGTVMVPLEKQMWGDEFGMCTDKFGVPWMVNISATPA